MKVIVYFLLLFSVVHHVVTVSTPCKLRETKNGLVCVCTDSYCDYVESPIISDPKQIWIVSSSKAGLRFDTSDAYFDGTFSIPDYHSRNARSAEEDETFNADAILVEENRAFLQFSSGRRSSYLFTFVNEVTVNIDRNILFQNTTEFGGAFTGAVSHVLSQLSPSLQDHVYRSFYHQDGIAFGIIRMSIGGSDFDLKPWTYLDQSPNDVLLKNFTELDERDKQKIVQMRRLKSVANKNAIKIIATAWSSPRWMKSNNDWTGFSVLKREYYQAWADYHMKFLELMNAVGFPIWAISTGNEPMNGVFGIFTSFISLGWTPGNMAIWLADHLGPTLRKSAYKNTLIFGNDDQRLMFRRYLYRMNQSRADSLNYLDGLAVHWYTDFIAPPSIIDKVHAEMPDKIIINTESCLGSTPVIDTRGPVLGSWERGEYYMNSFIEFFQHHYNGWVDWNLVLDEQGGPNYWKNYVDAPIIANVTSGNEIYKQPIFYALGHFSKFVSGGSVRIHAQSSNSIVQSIAFKRPDGKIAVLLFNSGQFKINVSLNDSIRGKVTLNLPPRSFNTVVYN